jgi:lipoprotein-anchoring transpeptidase ErfK/SrfK
MPRVSRRTFAAGVMIAAVFALPATAAASDGKATASAPAAAGISLKVGHLRGGKAEILSRVPITGKLAPFVAGQQVQLLFFRNGHQVGAENVAVHGAGGKGTFKSRFRVRRGGRFAVQAVHAATAEQAGASSARRKFGVSYPNLGQGKCGRVVRAFKKSLHQLGYVPSGGSCMNDKDGRAVLAYRKVNGAAHNTHAGSGIVKRVFSGRGAYHLKHPEAGDHVEVSIEHQVLVIAHGDKPLQTYGVSTGKSSTPTVTGHFQFYLRQPGYNSEGMYFSTYFHGGYAVHGYASVPPTYPASHGCVRVPIPDALHIYNSVSLGEDIFVY